MVDKEEKKYMEIARKQNNRKEKSKPIDMDDVVLVEEVSHEEESDNVSLEDERSLDGYSLMKIMEIQKIRIKANSLEVDVKHQRVFFKERLKKKIMVGNLKSLRNY